MYSDPVFAPGIRDSKKRVAAAPSSSQSRARAPLGIRIQFLRVVSGSAKTESPRPELEPVLGPGDAWGSNSVFAPGIRSRKNRIAAALSLRQRWTQATLGFEFGFCAWHLETQKQDRRGPEIEPVFDLGGAWGLNSVFAPGIRNCKTRVVAALGSSQFQTQATSDLKTISRPLPSQF